jgi:Uma2 family endonuclease
MTPVADSTHTVRALPTHLDLPCEDHTVVHNFFDSPQSRLLSSSVDLWISQHRPGLQYVIGEDSYIYWDITTPPTLGAKAPDWFFVEHRPRLLDGIYRNSYVLWQEHVIPTVLMEFVSETPGEEWDTTPRVGKFWVYEQGIKAPHYVIWDPWRNQLSGFQMEDGRYRRAQANERGHYPIEALGLEYGLWHGTWNESLRLWLRFWDTQGQLLLTPDEARDQIQLRAEQAEQAKRKAFEKLRELGIDPEAL